MLKALNSLSRDSESSLICHKVTLFENLKSAVREAVELQNFIDIYDKHECLLQVLFYDYCLFPVDEEEEDALIIRRLQLEVLDIILFVSIECRLTYSRHLFSGDDVIAKEINIRLLNCVRDGRFDRILSSENCFWFGGIHSQLPDSSSRNGDVVTKSLLALVAVESTTLHLSLLSCDQEKHEVMRSLNKAMLKMSIHDICSLSRLLFEQEDHVFKMGLCTLWAAKSCSSSRILSTFLNPFALWLSIMLYIRWDSSVLIDWTISVDTCFLLYLTKFLRFLLSEEASVCRLSLYATEARQICMSHADVPLELINQMTPVDSPILSLKIHEDLGGIDSVKQVRIYNSAFVEKQLECCSKPVLQQESTTCLQQQATSKEESYCSTEDINQRTTAVLGHLRNTLERSNQMNLIGFNASALLKLLHKVVTQKPLITFVSTVESTSV